jgi:multiple sugar transport system permease protein
VQHLVRLFREAIQAAPDHVLDALRNAEGCDIALFGEGLLQIWTVNSIWYTFASVALSVAISIPTGYVLATMQFRGRQLVMWLTLITMILPTSAMVLPLFLEMNLLHLVDNPWSVILPAAFAPFGVYLAYVYYSVTLPKDLLAAGKVDGCNEWQLFWHIGLPLGRTMIATLAFLTFNGAWNNYFLPFVMLNHKEAYNLPLGIAALTVETLLILLAAWQLRIRATRKAPQPQLERAERRAPEYSHSG